MTGVQAEIHKGSSFPQAGIQCVHIDIEALDPRLRGDDDGNRGDDNGIVISQHCGNNMSTTDRPRRPLFYTNEKFLDSEEAHPLRILAEYLEPMHAFHRARISDTIVFFGSARLAA